jgi:hypothetical protein
MILAALLIAVSTPASVAAARPSSPDLEVEAVRAANAALEPHLGDTGVSLDGKPGTDRLLEAHWRAVQNWAGHWLDKHPAASPAELEKAGEVFGKDEWAFSAASLGHGDVLVSAARWQVGNVFILGRSGRGGYRVTWSIAAPQQRLNAHADSVLSWWHAGVQNGHCGEDCRMMAGASVERLPAAANGAARFSIDAGYAQEAGGTVGRQLSFWSWQGGRAQPLLVHDYALGIDDDSTGGLRGSVLHVASKGQWNTLFACGSCAGRSTDLRFAIEPGRVRMLAPVSRTPEIDLVDRIYTRVLAHRSAAPLASPAALRVIRSRLADTDPKTFTGMVMGWARWRTRGVRWACLTLDSVSPTAFAFDAGLTRITEARALPADGCQGDGYRM